MSRTLARGLSALALGGLTSLVLILPAQAAGACDGAEQQCVSSASVFVLTDEQRARDALTTGFHPGETVTVVFDGFQPASDVRLRLSSATTDLGVFGTDDTGRVAAKVDLPAELEAGPDVLQVIGSAADGSAFTLATEITFAASAVEDTGGGNATSESSTVTTATRTGAGFGGVASTGTTGSPAVATSGSLPVPVITGTPPELAFTGFGVGATALVAAALIGAGTVTVLAGRKRRADAPAAS